MSDGKYRVIVTSDQADKEVFNDEVSFVDGKPDGSIIIELGTAASHILAVEIGAVQDSTTVVVESGSPATLSVTANPTTLTAGGNQVSTITALVTDSNSNPIEGVTVFFTSNGSGSIDPSSGVTDVSGKAVTTYTTAFGDDGSVVTVTAIEQENENANTIGITVKSPLPPPPPPPVPAPSARVGNVTVDGIVGSEITARDVVVTVFNDRFWAIGIGANLASWITNLPDGLDAKAKGAVIEGASQVTIKITGTPAEALKAAVSIKIPHTNLQTSVTDLAVTANADAKFEVIVPESIVTNERSGLSYETLQAAIDVAQIDDTLVFLTDSKESNVEITKPLTINFGDNTLIGNLTITDAVEGTVNLRGNIAAPPAYHLTGTLTDNKSGGATNNSLRIQGASPSIIITGSGVFTEDAEGNRVKVDSLTFEGITITSNASGLTLEVSAGTTLPRLIIEAGASSTRITNHGKINKFSNGSVDTIYGGKNPDEITGETLSRVPLAVGGVEEITVSNAEAGATVTLYDSDDNSIDTETADSSGEAIFTGVPAGTGYYVTQTVSGGESASSNTVVVDSNAKAITAFDFEGLDPTVVGTVDEGAKTVALTVPFGTDVTALVPTIMHTGASVAPNTGVAQDFSSSVTYTVTAADASMQDYVVTVNGVPEPAPEAETLTPLTDATGLAVDTIISILFDRDVTEMDFTGIKVEWDDDGTPTAIGIDTTPPALDGRTITITPNDNLAEETEYTVTIPEDAVENDDEVGNAEITWSFTTIQPAPENGVGPNSIIGSIPMNGNNSPGRSFDLRASKQRDVFIQNNNGPEYEVWVVPFIIGNASVLQEGTVNEHSVKFPVNDEGEFTVDIDLIDETLADVFVLILLDLSQTFRKDQLQGVVTLLSGDADLVMFPLDRIDGVVDLGALTIEDGFARSTNTLDYNSGSFTGGIDDLLDLANLDNYGTLVINDFVNENSSNSFYTSGTTLEFDFYEPQHNVPPSLDDYNWVQMELWMYSHDSTSTVEFHRPSGPLLDTLDNFGSGGLVKWGYNAPLDAPDRFDPFPGWYRATGSDRDFYLNYDLVLVKDNADKPILPTPRPTFTLDEDGIVTQMDISWSYRDANGVERDITDLTLLNRIIRNGVINVNYVNGNWCHFSFSADDSYVSFTDRWVLGSPDIERVVFHFGFGAFSCSFRLNFSQRSERAAANAEQLKEFLGQDNPKITTILIVEDFDLEEDLTVKNENTIIHLNDKTLGGDHTLTIEGENTTIKGGTLDLNVDVNTDVTFDGVTIGDDTITIAAGATLTFDGAQSIVGDATFVFTDRRATIAGAVNVNKNLVATMGYDNQVVDNKLHFTMGKELAIGQNVVINSNDIPLGDVTNEGLYANGVTDNAVLDGAAQADIITVQIVNVALAAGQTIEVNVELTANGEWEVVYNGVTFQTVGVPEAGFSASAPAEPTEGEIFNVTIEDAINDLFTDVEGEVNVTITSDNTDEGTEGVVYEDDATFTIGDATISIILNEIGTQILTIEIAGVTPTETVNVDVQENGVRPNSINGRLQPGSSENIESFRNVKNKIIRDADFSITPLGNNYSPYAEHKIWVVPIVRGNDSFIEEGSVWSYKTECNVQDDGSFELDIENLIQVYHQTVEDYVLLLIDETQEDRKDQVVSFITLSSDQLGDIVMMPLAEMKGNLNLGNVTVSSEEKTASSGLTLEDNETAFSTVGMDSIQQMARYQNLGRLVINDYINYHNENDKHSLDMMLVFRSNDEGRGALTRRDSIDYNDIEFENAEIRLYTTSKDSSFDLVLPDNTKAYGNCAGDGAVRWYWLVTQNDFSQEGWWNVETDESALAEFDFGLAVVRDQAGYPVAPVPVVEFEYGDQGQITSMAYKWHIDGEPLSDLALLERLFNRGEVEIQYTRRDDDNTVTIVDKELLSYQFSGGGIDIPVEQTGDILHIYFRFAAYRVVYEFSVEESIKVTGIEVTKQPTNLSYDEGEKLDLEGLEVTLTWSDTNTTVVGYADFGIHGLTAVPAHGTELTFIDYNGNPVTITHTQSEESDETQALTVTQVTVPAAPTTVTLNMQTGVTVNTLTTHEYSVDGGGSWTAFESDNEVLGAPVLAILSAAKDFQVRVAADGGAPAGAVHTIIINAAEPLATPVAGAIADGITITGLTNNAIYLYNPNNTGWRLGTASAGGELTNAGNALAVGESVLLRIISANDQAAATAHTVTRVSKAPEFNSAEVTNEVPSQLRVTFDVNVEVSDGVGEGGFSVGVTTPPAISISVDSVELADGYTVVLNLSRPVEYGDVITVSYDKNSGNIVSAVYSLEAQSFTDQEVNNKVLQSSQ